MSNDLQQKLKQAIGQLAIAEYEGDVVAFAGFYFTKAGEVKNILCFDNGQVLAVLGGTVLLQRVVSDIIGIKMEKN